jgi:hypothetical protein
MPGRHMEEWKYNSTHSWPHHAPVTLLPEKGPGAHYAAGCVAPKARIGILKGKKSPVPIQILYFVFSSSLLFHSLYIFRTCLFVYNTQHKYPCPRLGFEPAIPASEQPMSVALNRSATEIGIRTPYSPALSKVIILTCLLTPWSRFLPEKIKRPELLKKFPAFYGTRRFITAFTKALHLSLSWARLIQSMPPNQPHEDSF